LWLALLGVVLCSGRGLVIGRGVLAHHWIAHRKTGSAVEPLDELP